MINIVRVAATALTVVIIGALTACDGDGGDSSSSSEAATSTSEKRVRLPQLAARICVPGAPGCPEATASQNPVQTPRDTQVPEPDPQEVTGGGGQEGDPAAAARIQAQIPNQVQTTQIDSISPVLNYAIKLSNLDPTLKTTFSLVQYAAGCAASYGVMGARAYVDLKRLYAGAIVVFSQTGLQNLADTAVRCVTDKVAAVIGGGPTEQPSRFSPCLRKLTYTATAPDQVTDQYFVFILGTMESECEALADTYKALNPTTF